MSDWRIFELDNVIWDVIGDDCAWKIPHSSVGKVNNFDIQHDTYKKARHDIQKVKDRSIDTKESAEDVLHGNHETTSFQSSFTEEKYQSVNCPPSHAQKSVLPLSHDPKCIDEITTFSFADTTINGSLNSHIAATHDDDFFSDDPIPINNSITDEGNLCHFLIEVSPSETGLAIHDNESKVKENSDILDYDWPDVGCLDDVDKMLSCSTFGEGGPSNADDTSWLSSSLYTVNCREEIFKSGLQSSFSDLKALRDSSQTDVITLSENSLRDMDCDKASSFDYESFTNWLETDVQNKTDFPSKREVPMKKEGKSQLQTENIRTSECTNGSSCPVPTTAAHNNNNDDDDDDDNNNTFITSSSAAPLASVPHFSQSQYMDSDSSGCLNTPCTESHTPEPSPYMDSDSSGCLNTPCSESHTPEPSPTVVSSSSIKCIKEDKHSLLIRIPVEASNNGQQSMKIFSPSSNSPTIITAEKTEEMCLGQHLHTEEHIGHPHLKHVCSFGSVNQDSTEANSNEQRSQVNRNIQIEKASLEHPGDNNGSFGCGSSCISCTGDILLSPRTFQEFQEFQDVMNQLDIKTKLCMRDGLYRLAKSAGQRHSVESPKLSYRDKLDSGKFIGIDNSRRCVGYMDVEMETGTNPIDRSIVHLLFQRTSELPSCPAEDVMPRKTC